MPSLFPPSVFTPTVSATVCTTTHVTDETPTSNVRADKTSYPSRAPNNVLKKIELFESELNAEKEILVLLTNRNIYPSCNSSVSIRSRNMSNLIKIPLTNPINPNESEPKGHLPNFLSTNVRSLLLKIDELALILNHLSIDIAAVSETWLHSGIENEVLSIPNYNLIRQDRTFGRGGGVCAFVSNSIPYKRWPGLENLLYECLWLRLRPYRLPRKISSIVMGVFFFVFFFCCFFK